MRRSRRRRRLRVSVTMGLVAVLVAVGAVVVQRVSADASGCTGRVGLSVGATPEIAPALKLIASDWEGTRPQVDGACVEVTVVTTLAPVMASQLAALAGGTIDVEAPTEAVTSAEALPDVWVPDSTAWLGRVRDVNRTAFVDDPRSIATSPIVFAMPQPDARRLGWPNTPLQLAQFEQDLISDDSPVTLAFADPHRDTAALVATMLIGQPLSGSGDANLRALIRTFRALVKTHDTAQVLPLLGRDASAAPASEQAVIAFNAHHPAVPLAAVQLVPAPPDLDYPYAVRSDIADDRRQAADLFRATIAAPAAAQKLAEAAFRDPNGIAGPGFPAVTATNAGPVGAFAVDDPPQVQNALNLWAAINEPPRALALLDVSASMKTKMANGQTRASVMADAVHQGLNLLATDSEIGLWTFAGSHADVLSVAPLTSARRANFDQRLAAAGPTASDQVDLYGAVVDAYEEMQSAYDPSRPNFIIVLTDGGDSSPGGQRLKDFSRQIEQMADPTEPIRIAIIGIDVPPSGADDLQQVANLVGGGYFGLTDPHQIQTIVLKALLAVGEA